MKLKANALVFTTTKLKIIFKRAKNQLTTSMTLICGFLKIQTI